MPILLFLRKYGKDYLDINYQKDHREFFITTHTSYPVEGKADDCHGSTKALTRQCGGQLQFFLKYLNLNKRVP